MQVILTTLLKVYVRGELFEKSRELLVELESLGYAEDEVIETFEKKIEGLFHLFALFVSETLLNHFIQIITVYIDVLKNFTS